MAITKKRQIEMHSFWRNNLEMPWFGFIFVVIIIQINCRWQAVQHIRQQHLKACGQRFRKPTGAWKRPTNFFGEKFDRIEKNAKGFKVGFIDEYDILLINGRSVGIIEVKFKVHEDHIPAVLKKAETFRENFPYYAHHQVYLGLAGMAYNPAVEKKCIDQGIAVIKQVGKTLVIKDENLKAF